MDFFQICTKEIERGPNKGQFEVYPDFVVGRSNDLMIRGHSFYAVWDEERGLWSTDEYDVQRLMDLEMGNYAAANGVDIVRYTRTFSNNGWTQFRKFMQNVSDNSHVLDENLTFANTETKKSDYVSRRLPYPLASGDHSAWDELVSTLYSEEERAKIEWSIGAIVAGDAKKIQKFSVFYGPAGTGKSTILNIIQKLFEGYTTSFEAKALVGNNNSFATEVFRGNPLVAIQHDGDLSKIEDNTKLNSIIAHELMTMNEKYKPSYEARINAYLFMGTNKPVKITDAKSGIIRRLIDVHPTGVKLQPNHYHTLMAKVEFELGAIAQHCLDVYRAMGKNYYNNYRPLEMMLQTDVFFNFIEAHFDIFKRQDGASLKQAYALYKEWCNETSVEFVMPQFKFRSELRNYFDEFHERITIDGTQMYSYYQGFSAQAFKSPVAVDSTVFSLVLDETTSLFDLEYADQPAQEAKEDETPRTRWALVKTTLAEIDTSDIHYVKVPERHIVIDFDLKDDAGGKSLERNLRAASDWPATYAELSKGGSGVHLHYNYTGPDPAQLAPLYSDGIEVKVFSGDSSLRRRLSRCNNVPIADINSGLPLKEKKKVLTTDQIQSEIGLRHLIARNLEKEIHPGTKPSIDFIHHILEEAYLSGMPYDVTDMREDLVKFANNSTNRGLECLKIVKTMKFKSDQPINEVDIPPWVPEVEIKDERLVHFDVECFPNLFVVCWKYDGADVVSRMINPSAEDVGALFNYKLVGFNNRRYDNHMLYAAYLGYDNEGLYRLSKKIIEGNTASMFGAAYSLSWADIYDFSSKKQSLKKFQIELGIHHQELNLPWDEPVDPSRWTEVADYCANDVNSSEATFHARKADYDARLILASLSGLSVNDTTAKHTAKIVFGDDRNPQRSAVYTDLSKEFPGYVYEKGVSTYRGETVGEGGYVYAEPGMYQNVALLDVASMHPTSIKVLNLFGDYTPNFVALLDARLAIKRKDYDAARNMLGGKLAPFLSDPDNTKPLADALKIVINIVYGLTSAKFDNPFRDVRNKDNIVAKRGALFMIDLKHFIQEQGFTVAHIKTDSVKIPDATPEIIEQVKLFGEKYGYSFEYDPEKDFYDQFCLVNDAVYIARHDECLVPQWTAVGAQFQHPYVFKTLFSKEEITPADLAETKQVTQGAMYLDFDAVHKPMHSYEGMHFVGRTGRFVPVKEGFGGGLLFRVKDGKAYAVTGTKGYLWVEAELADNLGKDAIDMQYFENLADEAMKAIDFFGPYATFVK